jgi:hypothetical protein
MSKPFTPESSTYASYPQPAWNQPSTLVRVQEAVEVAYSRATADEASSALLYAVGNNHAGTYYPIVLSLFPIFESVLRYGSEWSRYAVLESLVDLCGSFEPASEYVMFAVPPSDKPLALSALLLSNATQLCELVKDIAVLGGVDSDSASELLRVLQRG